MNIRRFLAFLAAALCAPMVAHAPASAQEVYRTSP